MDGPRAPCPVAVAGVGPDAAAVGCGAGSAIWVGMHAASARAAVTCALSTRSETCLAMQ